jgi:predicted transcriptional regulator
MSAGNPTERPEPDDLEIVWQLADKRGEELQRLRRTLKKIATGKFSKDTMRMMAWEAIKDDEELKALMANG